MLREVISTGLSFLVGASVFALVAAHDAPMWAAVGFGVIAFIQMLMSAPE